MGSIIIHQSFTPRCIASYPNMKFKEIVQLEQYSIAVYAVSIPYINTKLLTFQGVILMKLGVFSASMSKYYI